MFTMKPTPSSIAHFLRALERVVEEKGFEFIPLRRPVLSNRGSHQGRFHRASAASHAIRGDRAK
jgi:hypothetical protein